MPAVRKPNCAGKLPVDERDGADDPRVQFLSESVEAFGEEHAIHAVGEVVVFSADVELSERILNDAR